MIGWQLLLYVAFCSFPLDEKRLVGYAPPLKVEAALLPAHSLSPSPLNGKYWSFVNSDGIIEVAVGIFRNRRLILAQSYCLTQWHV